MSPVIASITGTRDVKTQDFNKFFQMCDIYAHPLFEDIDEVLIGGALGVDLLFTRWVHRTFPQVKVTWAVPDTIKVQPTLVTDYYDKNKSKIKIFEIKHPAFPASEAYKARNKYLVDSSEMTIGFPKNCATKATGTWQTINYSLFREHPTYIIPLNFPVSPIDQQRD